MFAQPPVHRESRPRRCTFAPPGGPIPCLVVTGDRRGRDAVRLAIATTDWLRGAAPASQAELAAVAGRDFRLVFADLATLVGGYRCDALRLAARFARRYATLVTVCGSADDPAEERRARRLGVALYLPECPVAEAFDRVVSELCRW